MSPISRRYFLVVLVMAGLLTAFVATPMQAAVFTSPTPPPVCTGITYRVMPGDTLSSIARHFGTTVSAIVSCNGLTNPNHILSGQLLLIPTSAPVPPKPPTCGKLYTVRFGDTLSAIARRFGVRVSALVSDNNIVNPNLIWPGEVLRIPCGSTPFPTPPHSGRQWYQVKPGDTVSGIAASFDVSVWDIVNANHLDFPYTIYVGQWLRIP
jgi:LysM repeat protein